MPDTSANTQVEDDDSWKTPQLRAAEAHLDELATESDELIERADSLPITPDTDPASKDHVEALQNAANAKDAPESLRVLKQKVDAGEFSWSDVLNGKVYDDPEVRAAMMTKVDEMQAVYQEFEEGHTPDEVLEARGVNPLNPPGPLPQQDDDDDDTEPDDDDYYGGSIYDK